MLLLKKVESKKMIHDNQKTIKYAIIIALISGVGILILFFYGCQKYYSQAPSESEQIPSENVMDSDSYMLNRIERANKEFNEEAKKYPDELIHVMVTFRQHTDLYKLLKNLPEESQITGVRISFLLEGELYDFGSKVEDEFDIDFYVNRFLNSIPPEAKLIEQSSRDKFKEKPTVTALQIITPAGDLQVWLGEFNTVSAVELLPLGWRGLWRILL